MSPPQAASSPHDDPEPGPQLSRRAALGGAGAAAVGVGSALLGGAAGAAVVNHRDRGSLNPAELLHRGHGGDGALGVRRIVYSAPITRRALAITVDDGPDPEYTPAWLEILDRFDARATFNMMGHNVEAHPDLARRVRDAGHEVGNHGMTHIDLALAGLDTVRAEVVGGSDAIEQALGQRPGWLRPPRGDVNGATVRVAAETGHDLLMWTTGAAIGLDEPTEEFVDRIAVSAAPGHIINLHDGIGRGTFFPRREFGRDLAQRRRRELEALPMLLRRLADDGFALETVGQLLSERVPPATGGRGIGG